MAFSYYFLILYEYFIGTHLVTCNELGEETHTRMFKRQLDANNVAYNEYQACKESSKYTTFRLKQKDIPLEDFLSLYETLYNIESKGNMSTIITIIKRDKDLPDNKDMNMKNLASALQEYLYNESGSRFNVGNMVVTIESVRKEHMPGFCTISNRSEKVRQVYCKLNTLLIDLSDRFLLEKYEKWMRDWFYRYTIELLKKLDIKDCSGYEQIFAKINAYFTNERPKQIFGYMKVSQQEAYQDAMEEKHNIKYSPDLEYIRPKLLEFEEKTGCKYFTYDLTEYDKILNTLRTYYEHCSYRDLKLAFKKGSEELEKLRSEQTTNNIALKSACETLLKNLSFEEIEKHAATNFETITETEMCVISDICHGYIEAVGLLAKYKQLFASNRSALNRQRKRFEIKNVVKLVVSEKASVNNLNFLLDVIGSENVLNDLNENQLVYLDLGRAIESSTLEEGMKKYETKEFYLNNGAKYIFSANEVLEVVSKNDGFGPKCDANEPQDRKSTVLISWTAEKIVYDEIWKSIYMVTVDETNTREKSRKELTDAINKPMLECLADSNSRPTGLYKLAVQSSSINTNIYFLNHKAIFDNCERVSVIYAFLGSSTLETSNEEDLIVLSVICLADVPPSHLIDLLKYLQILQARPETEFIVPNILKLKGEIFACFDNRLELTGKYKTLDFYECFENMVKCESTDPYSFNENPQYIKYWSYITYIRSFQIYQNFRMEKGEDDIIYNHIQNFFVDNDLLEDELNDPCILSIDSITYENKTYPCFSGSSTHPQHFCVTKKCSATESLSSNPLQIANILLNSKHAEDVFDALCYIVNIMKSNAEVLHMAIDEMCAKEFNFLSYTETKSQNDSNMVNVLKRFGSLFGHFENWKSQNVCKTKDEIAYFEEQKTLLKTKIETLLKILYYERRDLETYRTIKMTSIRQIGGAAKNATGQLEKLTIQGCDMAYVNFSCLKVSKKIFSKDKWGRRYTTRN